MFFLQKGPHTKVTVFGSIKSTQLARFVQRFGIKKIQHVVIYAMAVCTMNAWAKTFTKKTRTLIASKRKHTCVTIAWII